MTKLRTIDTVGVVVMLGVIFTLGSYGQGYYDQSNLSGAEGIVFPVYNPCAGEVWQAAQMLASWDQMLSVSAPPVAPNGGLPPGVSMNDGSAQLYQATLQAYQVQANQDRQFAQWGMNMMANPTPENARIFQMLGNMADAGLSSARNQSQEIERDQRRTANLDLYNATGKEHWQYSNRPVTPGAEQDAYDNWNRVNRRLSR